MAHRLRMEAVHSITSIVISASQMEVLKVQMPPMNYTQHRNTGALFWDRKDHICLIWGVVQKLLLQVQTIVTKWKNLVQGYH